MARDVREPAAARLRDLLELLRPHPGRWELAVRLALICALTALVTEIYQTPEAALSIYVAFFFNREDRAVSVAIEMAVLVLITAIVAFVMLLAMAVIDDPMWRVFAMALTSFGCLYLVSASKLGALGAYLGLIIAYALDVLGLVPAGEVATRGLLYLWLILGIPAAISLVVNVALAPAPRRLAEHAIARRLALSAAVLETADARTRRDFTGVLREGAGAIERGLALARVEHSSPPADIAALRHAAGSSLALMSAIDVMDRDPGASLPQDLRARVAQQLRDMAAVFAAGGYPVEIQWQARTPDPTLTPPAATVLAEIEHALARFAEPPNTAPAAAHAPAQAGGFFKADAFSNPEHVQYALKTTAAAMFCYLLYSILDWPGIHTCFITCYFVALGTVGETVQKLSLRLLGCLIGAAAGIACIVFLIPQLDSIGGLMLAVFFGALLSAYVAGGSQRISYAGLQIAFAFFLCTVQGPSPDFDLVVARDRIIGILLGNLVVYVLFTHLWPVSVVRRIDPAIAALLQRLAALATAPDAEARRALASQAQAGAGAIEADLEVARYEPVGLRPPSAWLEARQRAAHALGALAASLLVCAEQGADLRPSATRLEALARSLESMPAAPAAGVHGESSGRSDNSLQSLVAAQLSGLERDLSVRTYEEAEAPRHAPA